MLYSRATMLYLPKILSVLFCLLFFQLSSTVPINDRPIIGIVVEETHSKFSPQATAALYASYVKFVEAGGARVIPIFLQQSEEYYNKLLSQINGVLFPGGANLVQSDGYGRTGRIIFKIASKMNDNGTYFPLWGTCLGFELLNFLVAGKLWMKACSAEDLSTNINFVNGFNDSRMFGHLEDSMKHVMQKELVTIHFHQWCITPENYSMSGLDKYFKVLAINQDRNNVAFVSAVEAINYPFYGVAFHPEKVMFEWVISDKEHNIPHSSESIRVSQYFANFFVNEARKNLNKFPYKEDEDDLLIYNYNPFFTGKYNNNSVQQKYYFE
ncbi:gamma-glutamyl hydrolase-like [Uloborus diversus]|uniref:gamma-glutamyl hydrolase-like n=1 Tax=Uloborus diversus TaxID=327109 RepID=UPI00240A929A|nr:gamma-glutamyl hydrolase-like [Uloborus diversus]